MILVPSLAAGTVTVTGQGQYIAGTANQFHFVYLPISGNGSITARIQSQTNTDPWTTAGVMIRHSLDASDYFYIARGLLTGGNTYAAGDFTFSGAVDADDYYLIDWAYLNQQSTLKSTAPLAKSAAPAMLPPPLPATSNTPSRSRRSVWPVGAVSKMT